MIGEQLRLHNIEVKKELGIDLPMILGDKNHMEQVVLNLITNARDAIEERRKKGAINKKGGIIEIMTRRSDQDEKLVEIVIKDTGTGIASEIRDKIFDPFFTTKEIGKGTGLGLSISYGIIQNHNGNITIAETSPEGTSFCLRLPIAT